MGWGGFQLRPGRAHREDRVVWGHWWAPGWTERQEGAAAWVGRGGGAEGGGGMPPKTGGRGGAPFEEGRGRGGGKSHVAGARLPTRAAATEEVASQFVCVCVRDVCKRAKEECNGTTRCFAAVLLL